MENLIEELTKVNPSNLSEEGLKLFNKINEIIDRNKELEEENKELKKDIKNMYDEEVVINIISDEFNLTRSEVLGLLGEEED